MEKAHLIWCNGNGRACIARFIDEAKHDWENSHKLDLTDEGLFEDLKKRMGETDNLVLDTDEEKKKNKK